VGTDRLATYAPRLVLGERGPVAQHWAAEGSLLFCDVSGFTRLSEKLARQGKAGAEELVTNLSSIYTALLSATEDGGDLLKFSGDAMVIFYEDDGHAARAVHAAQGMRRALRDVGSIRTSQGQVRLRMSTGIHSGEFRFFLCGDDHLELLAAGPAVTRTVQMEAAADAGEILLSGATAADAPSAMLGEPKGGGVLLRRHRPLPPRGAYVVPPVPDELAARFVPRLLRDRIGVEGAENDHRQATIAFLQFRGTDDLLAERGPDEVFTRLQALTLAVQEATARYDVCVVATDIDANGGKFMLAAGAPCASEDDEGRMLRACLDILSRDVGLPIRVGVNRGHVFGGDVGAPFRRTYSTMGDATNLAARIMGKAPVGQLLVHRSVLERADDRFVAEPVAPFTVKGKTAPVEASLVLELADDEPAGAAGGSPLVGREPEMAALSSALARADEGVGVVVELTGEPGVGGSRLLTELIELAARSGERRHLHLRCDPYARATAYAAAGTLLRDALGIPATASRTEAGAAATATIRAVVPEIEPHAALLSPVLHADLAWSPALEDLSDRFRLARTHTVATRLLRAVLPHALITIDDAAWMDEASARLLADVLRRTRDRRWLVALARSTEERGLHSGLGFRAEPVALGPLSPAASCALVQRAAADRPLPPRALEAVVERGAGNPLFLLELVAAAVDGPTAELPGSVEAIVTSRLDRLSIADRRALRELAVLGTTIEPEVVDGVLGSGGVRSSDGERWSRLSAFVTVTSEGALAFRSSLHRDAAYEGLTFSRRRELHAKVADWLEATAHDGPAAAPALSWHYHQAQRWERSWTHSLRAAEQARAVFAHAEAARGYRRALAASRWLPEVAPDEVRRVAELLGDEEELSGRYREAKEAYRQARRHAADALSCTRLLHKEGVVEERTGRYPQSLRWYSRGLRAADRIGDDRARTGLRAELAVAYAGVRFRQGKLDSCASWCRRALDGAGAADRIETSAHAYYLLEAAYGMLGDPRADEVRGRSLPLYERAGDLLGQGNVLNNLGITAYYRGAWDEALELYERSREAFTRVGDDVAAATAANNIAEILSDQGRLHPAGELFREALAIWRSVEYPIGVALAISNLGRLALRAGDAVTAIVELEEALRRFDDLGSGAFVLETRVRRAETYLALGRCGAALEEAATILAAAEREGGGVLAVAALRLHGSALVACGGPGDGISNLRDAVVRAREIGADHELALSLAALAEHDPQDRVERRAEAAALFSRLGVVAAATLPGSVPDTSPGTPEGSHAGAVREEPVLTGW
jgi:class 3 adenylate cyclase/tetratricopeptide (TPR) repeat protein